MNPLEYSDDLKNNLKAYITNQAKKACFDYSRKLQVEENRGSRPIRKNMHLYVLSRTSSLNRENQRSNRSNSSSLTREKLNAHSSNLSDTSNLVVEKPTTMFNYDE